LCKNEGDFGGYSLEQYKKVLTILKTQITHTVTFQIKPMKLIKFKCTGGQKAKHEELDMKYI